MLWLIILPVLAALFALVKFRKSDSETRFGMTVAFVALGAIAAVIVNTVAIWTWGHTTWVRTDNVPLQSMAADSTIHGSFFLASGTIDGETVYHYFARQGDGGYYEASVPTYEATVYETDGPPHLERWEDRSANWWTAIFNGSRDNVDYAFYVPKGSVVQTYTLKP